MGAHERNAKLFDLGSRALHDLDYKRASRIGQKLIDGSYSGGYELKARALYEIGEVEEATRLLELGTKRYPSISILWSYLGEYYSNCKRFDDALAAFQQCRAAGGDDDWTTYNLATVYGRQGRFDLALRTVEQCGEGEVELHEIHSAKSYFLNGLSRFEEALAATDASIRWKDTSEGQSQRAIALLRLGRREEARDIALAALVDDKTRTAALDVLRDFNDPVTDSTRSYCIMVRGNFLQMKMPETGLPISGFMAKFWCAADSPEECLDYYAVIEPDAVDLSVEKSTVVDSTVTGNKGLLKVQGGYPFMASEPNIFKRFVIAIRAVAAGGNPAK